MLEKVRLELAKEEDAAEIRDMMVIVSEDETKRWFNGTEGPVIPGYNSIDMQKYHMRENKYYKILYENNLAGVLLITHRGKEHARIDRLYVSPNFQNKGIGGRALRQIEALYPMVKVWTLDTIQKSPRNHHFYEKLGYQLIGEDEVERYYMRIIGTLNYDLKEYITNTDFNNQNFRNCTMEQIDFYDINMKSSNFTSMNLKSATFQNSTLSNSIFTNVNLSKSTFGDSNMSEVEICHSSLAGAYIHDTNLGYHNKTPLVMERCELTDSRISDSDLQNLTIENCNLEGMTIDGILVSELIKVYQKNQK